MRRLSYRMQRRHVPAHVPVQLEAAREKMATLTAMRDDHREQEHGSDGVAA